MRNQKADEFKQKGEALTAAYNRTQQLLKKYLALLPDWPYSWDFNLLHDLNDRIKDRIADHNSDVYDYHWNEYGFNAYSV